MIDTPGIPNDGSDGMLKTVIQRIAMERGRIHLLLYVVRLDDPLPTQWDHLAVSHLVQGFGRDLVRRLCLVFTHGHALPPGNMEYFEFLRGRRDLVWTMFRKALPYRLARRPHGVTMSSDGDTGTSPEDSSEIQPLPQDYLEEIQRPRGLLRWLKLFHHPRPPPTWWQEADEEEARIGSDMEYVQYLSHAPEMIVVENSVQCPTDVNGQKILPDGTPWLTEFYETLAEIIRRLNQQGEIHLEELELVEERPLIDADDAIPETRMTEGDFALPVKPLPKAQHGWQWFVLQVLAVGAICFGVLVFQERQEAELLKHRLNRTADENGTWKVGIDDIPGRRAQLEALEDEDEENPWNSISGDDGDEEE
uniref:AIG1-type G domain-containing protein n=1 Tax=Compsopogon caeruleus TaxID=31354 RepID=A0A7S1TKI3_9RHOD